MTEQDKLEKQLEILFTSPYTSIKEQVRLAVRLIVDAGYRQLDPDQSLPINPHSDTRTLQIRYNAGLKSGFVEGQDSMLKANFRKVKLEAK